MRKIAIFASILWVTGCGAASTARGPAVASSGANVAVATTTTDPASTDTGVRRDTGTRGAWIGVAPESDVLATGDGTAAIGLWVDAPQGRPREHVPMDVALVVDTSGSMGGPKIDNARRAAALLVDDLSDGDIVSLVSFSDEARTIAPPTVLSTASRASLKRQIVQLTPTGSTNMFDGLALGESQVARAPATHTVRRVVVISDGIANVGPSSPESLGALAERGLRFQAQVTSLGVGTDYDEHTLDALAVRSTGRLYHLSEPREMVSLLQHELDLLRSTVATHAFVEVLPAPGVDLVSVEGCRSERGENGSLKLPLGALFSGQHREALLRVRIRDASVTSSRALASVRLHFDDPADGDLPRIQEVVARAAFSDDASAVASGENAKAKSIIAVLDASKLELGASESASTGQFAEADKQLAQAEEALESRAKKSKDDAERTRLVAVARKVAHARTEVQAAPRAAPSVQRNLPMTLNAAGMHDAGF
ncbi:MAG TPA: VWA domain-containing protein [Polyangiaceae bacterium]|jgi:Ca-activated chloride channel family protein